MQLVHTNFAGGADRLLVDQPRMEETEVVDVLCVSSGQHVLRQPNVLGLD